MNKQQTKSLIRAQRKCVVAKRRLDAARKRYEECVNDLKNLMIELNEREFSYDGYRARFYLTFRPNADPAVLASRFPHYIRTVYKIDGWAVRRGWNTPDRHLLKEFVEPVDVFQFGEDRRKPLEDDEDAE